MHGQQHIKISWTGKLCHAFCYRRLLSQEEQAVTSTLKAPLPSSVDMDHLRRELQQSVMNPGYEVKPDHLSPHVWAKHSRYLNQYVQAVKSGSPNMWSVEQVAQFVWSIPDCCHVAHNFREQVSDCFQFQLLIYNIKKQKDPTFLFCQGLSHILFGRKVYYHLNLYSLSKHEN